MEGAKSDKTPLFHGGTGGHNYGAVPGRTGGTEGYNYGAVPGGTGGTEGYNYGAVPGGTGGTEGYNYGAVPGGTGGTEGYNYGVVPGGTEGYNYGAPPSAPTFDYAGANPSVNGDGYYQLPPQEEGYQPPVFPSSLHSLPPSQQTLPTPVYQQQQMSSNVVVVNQPQPQQVITEVRMPRASTFLLLTAVLMILCFLHGDWVAFACLIPAVICSCVAEDHNNAGRYEEAKSCGNTSLFCNLCSLIYFAVVIMAVVAFVIAFFAVGSAVVLGALAPRCYSLTEDRVLITECY